MQRTLRWWWGVAFLLLAGCPKGHDKPALVVGPVRFDAEEVEARYRAVDESAGGQDARLGTYAKLIQGYLAAEALKNVGTPLSPEQIEAEVARIDENTKRPEELERIKKAFGDPGRYRRLYVLPQLALRRFFFEIFPSLESVHAERRALATKTAADLSGRETDEWKLDAPWQRREMTFSKRLGFGAGANAMAQRPPAGDPGLFQSIEEKLSAVSEGELVSEPFETPTAFFLVRWLGWKDETEKVRRVELFVLPKVDAHETFWRLVASVPVHIANEPDERSFRQKVSWAARVHWLSVH